MVKMAGLTAIDRLQDWEKNCDPTAIFLLSDDDTG